MIALHLTQVGEVSCSGCALDPESYPGCRSLPRTMTTPVFLCDTSPYPCDGNHRDIQVRAAAMHDRITVLKSVTPAIDVTDI